jgi:hypothetical protein
MLEAIGNIKEALQVLEGNNYISPMVHMELVSLSGCFIFICSWMEKHQLEKKRDHYFPYSFASELVGLHRNVTFIFSCIDYTAVVFSHCS